MWICFRARSEWKETAGDNQEIEQLLIKPNFLFRQDAMCKYAQTEGKAGVTVVCECEKQSLCWMPRD